MECLVWCFGNRAVGWADVRKTDVHGVPKSVGSETMERAESRRERCPCRFGLGRFGITTSETRKELLLTRIRGRKCGTTVQEEEPRDGLLSGCIACCPGASTSLYRRCRGPCVVHD